MRLLSRLSAHAKIKKENEELVDTNIRLRKSEKTFREKLNTIKEDYSPDKVKKLKEFEDFCFDIQKKKGVLLEELASLEKAVENKKELYYGLVAKSDALTEREHTLGEREKKLDLRLIFVEELENKLRNEIIEKETP